MSALEFLLVVSLTLLVKRTAIEVSSATLSSSSVRGTGDSSSDAADSVNMVVVDHVGETKESKDDGKSTKYTEGTKGERNYVTHKKKKRTGEDFLYQLKSTYSDCQINDLEILKEKVMSNNLIMV